MSKQCCMQSLGEIGEGEGLAWRVGGVEGKVTVPEYWSPCVEE